jgi:hypothetical protein
MGGMGRIGGMGSGIDLFPASRLWIQKDEYDYYTSDAWRRPAPMAASMQTTCWRS